MSEINIRFAIRVEEDPDTGEYTSVKFLTYLNDTVVKTADTLFEAFLAIDGVGLSLARNVQNKPGETEEEWR